MDEAVRAEASAVADLRVGVERFATHVTDALADARSQLCAAQQKVLGHVERCRSDVDRASRALAQAEVTLSGCRPEGRPAAAQLVARARTAKENAVSLLNKARSAADTIDRAGNNLQRSLSASQAQIDEHAGASKSYLAALEMQLKAIDVARAGGGVRGVAGASLMIGKALMSSEILVQAALTAVEKVAHLPDGMLEEVGGLVQDVIDNVQDAPHIPLGEDDAVLNAAVRMQNQ